GCAGSLHRWLWPDSQINRIEAAGSHDFGLASALELAGKLGRLPNEVVVWGIEAGQISPAPGLSAEVEKALPALIGRIHTELKLGSANRQDYSGGFRVIEGNSSCP